MRQASLPLQQHNNIPPLGAIDQLHSLEQLVESFGETTEIVQAVADQLFELREYRAEFDSEGRQRFEWLWRIVSRHARPI